MKTYILVEYPESQSLMEHPKFNECFPCIGDNAPEHAYFVPKELYDDIKNNFKDGDILVNNTSCNRITVIYYKTGINGEIITYAGTSEDFTTITTDIGWGYTNEFNYATEEDKKFLNEQLRKNNVYWDEVNKQIKPLL